MRALGVSVPLFLAWVTCPVLAAPPTFSRDVAPILNAHCVRCHRAGEVAPMAFSSYQAVRPYAKAIRDEVLARTMPPWKADPEVGKFANEARLSEADIGTLVRWVAAGSPPGQGPPPPRPRFVPGWNIGRPDVEFALPAPVSVPKDGRLENQYFTVPTGFAADRWISAMEIRPGNARVVHHATVFLLPAAGTRDEVGPPGVACRDAAYGEAILARLKNVVSRGTALDRQYLFSWTPGSEPFVARAGAARRIPAGANLVFEMHYAPDGRAETTDRTKIGFRFAKEPIAQPIDTVTITNRELEIPPGEANQEVKACYHLVRPRVLLSIKPHMHLRGKDMCFTLIAPSGERTPLLSVPRWDFDWQLSYVLKQPLTLASGSRIEIIAHYDNSPQNKRNPDPSRTVTWDESSTGEMLAGMLVLAEPIR